MEFTKLLELLSAFDQSGLTSLCYETGECKISLEKAAASMMPPVTPVIPTPTQAPAAQTPAASGITVTAPIVGVVYCASAPGKKPYITAGQSVKKGDVLCLIEAMKTINEVKAPSDGTVKEICFTDGELKEFGAPLVVIGEN